MVEKPIAKKLSMRRRQYRLSSRHRSNVGQNVVVVHNLLSLLLHMKGNAVTGPWSIDLKRKVRKLIVCFWNSLSSNSLSFPDLCFVVGNSSETYYN